MESRGRCSGCGENGMVLDEIDGILACDSCGRVGDQTESEFRSEWQIGDVINRQGTYVGDRDGGAAAAKRLMESRTSHSFYNDSLQGKERYRYETMKKVDSIVAILRVPRDQVDQAKHILESTLDGEWGTGRWVDILVAACVYVVIRQNQLPLSIPEVANSVNCDVVEVGRMYNRVLRKLGISTPTADAAVFLERAASTLPALTRLSKDVTRNVVNQGTLLVRYVQKCFIFTGRRPLPVVAAALYLVLEANEVVVEFSEVADKLGVGMSVARNRYKECQVALVGFGQILPWGKDITLRTVKRHVPELLKMMDAKAKIEVKKRKREAMAGSLTNGQKIIKTAPGAPLSHPAHENRPTDVGFGFRASHDARVVNSSAAEEQHRNVSSEPEMSGDNSGQRLRGSAGQKLSSPSTSSYDCGEIHERSVSDAQPLEGGLPLDAGETICLACAPERVCSCRDGCSVMVNFSSTYEDHVNVPGRPEMPGQAIKDEVKSSAAEEFEPRHKQPRWEGLPAAFCASVDARTRRLDKILLAKERIVEARQVLSCITQRQPADAVRNLTFRQKAGSYTGSNKRSSSLDWEDLTIEHLLLSGATEAEIETGYYRSVLARYPVEADIDATHDDVTPYIRTRSEVEWGKQSCRFHLGLEISTSARIHLLEWSNSGVINELNYCCNCIEAKFLAAPPNVYDLAKVEPSFGGFVSAYHVKIERVIQFLRDPS